MTKTDLSQLGLTYEQIEAVWPMLGKDYVPKNTFNETNEKLKKALSENEALKNKTTELEKVATEKETTTKAMEELQQQHQKELEKLKIESAVSLLLTKEKGRNEKAIKALIESDKITIDESGNIEGLNEQIETIKKENPYLFEAVEETTATVQGVVPADGKEETPDNALMEEINKAFGF